MKHEPQVQATLDALRDARRAAADANAQAHRHWQWCERQAAEALEKAQDARRNLEAQQHKYVLHLKLAGETRFLD